MNHCNEFRAAVLAACLLSPLTSLAQSTAPKPITHEALWMMKRVGAPAVSPDGKWVVFSVLEPSYEADKAVSDLCWHRPMAFSSRAASPTPRRRRTTSRGLPTAPPLPSPPSAKATRSIRYTFSIWRRAAMRAGSPIFPPEPRARSGGRMARPSCSSPASIPMRWTTKPTRRSPRSIRSASTTSGCMSTSPCATGINGWMSASRP